MIKRKPAKILLTGYLVPLTGVEPVRLLGARDFKSLVSAYSTTAAKIFCFNILQQNHFNVNDFLALKWICYMYRKLINNNFFYHWQVLFVYDSPHSDSKNNYKSNYTCCKFTCISWQIVVQQSAWNCCRSINFF